MIDPATRSDEQPRSYGALWVLLLNLALWWGILASLISAHAASMVVTGAACALATIAALAHLPARS